MHDRRAFLGVADTAGNHRIPQQQAQAISSQAGEQTAPTSATVTSHQQSTSLETSDRVTLSRPALVRDS